ncbi:MAG: modification methylase HemK, partial [Candidatus Methanomethylophilaceae archaeon]
DRLLEGAVDHLEENGRMIVVVSSLMDQRSLQELLSCYDVEVIGRLALFFEELRVLRISGF